MLNPKNQKLNKFLKEGGIPSLYLKLTDLTGYPVVMDKLAKISDEHGLLIYGGVGSGKTQLAVDLMEYLAEEKQTNQEVGENVDYVDNRAIVETKWEKAYNPYLFQFFNVPKLLIQIRGLYDHEGESVEEFINNLDSYEYLILDDLGAEKPSEWVLEILYVIINQRYEKQKKLIVTSNKSTQELGNVLGDRIASRLMEMCKVIKIGSEDRRAKL